MATSAVCMYVCREVNRVTIWGAIILTTSSEIPVSGNTPVLLTL